MSGISSASSPFKVLNSSKIYQIDRLLLLYISLAKCSLSTECKKSEEPQYISSIYDTVCGVCRQYCTPHVCHARGLVIQAGLRSAKSRLVLVSVQLTNTLSVTYKQSRGLFLIHGVFLFPCEGIHIYIYIYRNIAYSTTSRCDVTNITLQS